MRGCSACLWCGVVRWLPLATDRRTATLCSWPIFPHTRCLIHAPMHPCTTLYGRLKRLEATNCMLDAFNIECSEELALAMNRFQNHTRTLIQAKNDLHSIFRRIRWVEYQAGRGGVFLNHRSTACFRSSRIISSSATFARESISSTQALDSVSMGAGGGLMR